MLHAVSKSTVGHAMTSTVYMHGVGVCSCIEPQYVLFTPKVVVSACFKRVATPQAKQAFRDLSEAWR